MQRDPSAQSHSFLKWYMFSQQFRLWWGQKLQLLDSCGKNISQLELPSFKEMKQILVTEQMVIPYAWLKIVPLSRVKKTASLDYGGSRSCR